MKKLPKKEPAESNPEKLVKEEPKDEDGEESETPAKKIKQEE